MNDETLREEMRRGFSEVSQRLTGLDEHLDTMDGRLGSLDERVRHGGVLLEVLRNDVRQLAETQVLAGESSERYRQENDAAHREILALLRISYRDLDRRVSRLEAPGGEGTAQSQPL